MFVGGTGCHERYRVEVTTAVELSHTCSRNWNVGFKCKTIDTRTHINQKLSLQIKISIIVFVSLFVSALLPKCTSHSLGLLGICNEEENKV